MDYDLSSVVSCQDVTESAKWVQFLHLSPFDLHSVAMFDSHLPCHDHAILKATSQGHITAQHVHGMAWHV
jgi:hypothetical protein